MNKEEKIKELELIKKQIENGAYYEFEKNRLIARINQEIKELKTK